MLRFSNINEDQLSGSKNWFDTMRLLAAFMVIIAHAFPVHTGATWTSDPILLLSKITDTGGFGVITFFIISGFLVTRSLENKSFLQFFKNRFLRIYPAYFTVIILSAFVIGPLFSAVVNYFNNPSTYSYLTSLLFFRMEYHLPGVFPINPLATQINGSLWTIQYEVCCYILLPALVAVSFSKKRIMLFLFLFMITCGLAFRNKIDEMVIPFLGVDLKNFFDFFCYFLGGSLIYQYRNIIRLNLFFALLLVVFSFALPVNPAKFFSYILLPYFIICFAFLPKHESLKFPDISYGLYLYGFPSQQIIQHLLPQAGIVGSVFMATLLAGLLGYISWIFIEKPALSLKSRTLRHSPKH